MKLWSFQFQHVVKKTLIRPQVVKKTLIRPQNWNRDMSEMRGCTNPVLDHSRRFYTTRNHGTDAYTTRNHGTDAFNEALQVIISYQEKRFDDKFLDTMMPELIRCLHAKAFVMGIYSDELVHKWIVHLYSRFVWPVEFMRSKGNIRSRITLLPVDSAKISPETHLPRMGVPSKGLRTLFFDRIDLPSKVLLSRILVVDRIASLKLLQSFHAKTVVMGIALDKEMHNTLEDLYHIVRLPCTQKLVEEGKLDEAVKLVKEMSPFKVKKSLCDPIIEACAKSLPVNVKTVRELFEMMRIRPNETYFLDRDVRDKLEAAGIVWPCLVLTFDLK